MYKHAESLTCGHKMLSDLAYGTKSTLASQNRLLNKENYSLLLFVRWVWHALLTFGSTRFPESPLAPF